MARRRRKDGTLPVPQGPVMGAADARAGMMARLVEKADNGCLASAALVIMLNLDRQQRLNLVTVANALDGADAEDAYDA